MMIMLNMYSSTCGRYRENYQSATYFKYHIKFSSGWKLI